MPNNIKKPLCLVGVFTLVLFLGASCSPPPEPLPLCEGSLTLPGTTAGYLGESLAEFAWSPDGKFIVFREWKKKMQLINVDNIFTNQAPSQPRELTSQIGFGITWSPDSEEIAFTLREENGDAITKMDIDNGQETRITDGEWDANPTWLPDGEHIAFYRNNKLYVMKSDGSNQIQLIEDQIGEFTVSPSGEKVVFTSYEGDIYVIDVMSGYKKQLTDTSACEGYPSWSPDGQKIVFESTRDATFGDIFIMNADGSGQLNLTNSERGEGQTSWSPDGSQIAFVAERDIYVMNADGSELRQVTDTPNEDESLPLWSPDGQQLAFMVYSNKHWYIDVINLEESERFRLASVQ